MNTTIEAVGLGAIVPAVAALAVFAVARRAMAEDTAERSAAALAFGLAYGVGYGLLAERADLVPKRHWHWMLYLVLAASVLGPIAVADGVRKAERWALILISSLVAAALLVPHWASLKPSRAVWVPSLTAYLGGLALALGPLARRVSARLLLAALTLAAAGVAVLIAAFISLTYARPAGCAAAALAGCWAASLMVPGVHPARGLGLAYSFAVGGWAYVGCIDPPRPLLGLLIAPVAPVALWICALGPPGRSQRLGVRIAAIAAVLVVLGVAAGFVAVATGVL
jgi:hypothetical protein